MRYRQITNAVLTLSVKLKEQKALLCKIEVAWKIELSVADMDVIQTEIVHRNKHVE